MPVCNLELKLGKKKLCSSSVVDGKSVYRAVPALADLLDSDSSPDQRQYERWFWHITRNIFKHPIKKKKQKGSEYNVAIDTEKKLVLHDADKDMIPESTEKRLFAYDYEMLPYRY
ncbi:hypothetical protein KY345_04360, partial [Candidatus Woesearchaeota archaeon]|nr:hypothetical protein [Candidatus Woesearchaeota archaeon]